MIGYPDSEQIPNVGASSAFTQKQKVLKPLRFQDFYWSEWRDLNSTRENLHEIIQCLPCLFEGGHPYPHVTMFPLSVLNDCV